MRAWATVLFVLVAAGCSPDPICANDDGDELPICDYTYEGEALQFCPGDEWGADDGCNSCACQPDGVVKCNENDC